MNNNGYHIKSRTTAYRELFNGTRPALRVLAQARIADYKRREKFKKTLLNIAAVLLAFGVVGVAMLLKALLR